MEVLKNTGRGLASWHGDTAKPLLTIEQTYPLLLSPSREWLNTRIAKRFESMLARGLLEEAQANASDWSPARPSAKAIGAAELMQFLSGELTQELLASQVTTHTRQYAKRQRTWFRARMASWHRIDPRRTLDARNAVAMGGLCGETRELGELFALV